MPRAILLLLIALALAFWPGPDDAAANPFTGKPAAPASNPLTGERTAAAPEQSAEAARAWGRSRWSGARC
jgi:hypothetical protein